MLWISCSVLLLFLYFFINNMYLQGHHIVESVLKVVCVQLFLDEEFSGGFRLKCPQNQPGNML